MNFLGIFLGFALLANFCYCETIKIPGNSSKIIYANYPLGGFGFNIKSLDESEFSLLLISGFEPRNFKNSDIKDCILQRQCRGYIKSKNITLHIVNNNPYDTDFYVEIDPYIEVEEWFIKILVIWQLVFIIQTFKKVQEG